MNMFYHHAFISRYRSHVVLDLVNLGSHSDILFTSTGN